ncbi:response regulator transcription factor [Acetobacter conturbans]|uniref:Response regulator n=1 Tax=Acetobacter conturbans TaxID=1737472 RepID=A0ABX0JXN5_9PROT|nr:DNA-binding response regulator [Acetobacter conturbans]NHN88061.1 response regulator [Acetobacter conturbans]
MNSTPAVRSTLLVIDDDPAALGMMDDALNAAGYSVLLAQSGEAALEVMGRKVPDLVLVDAIMPGLSGWDICQRMKADGPLNAVPVIFMTGLTEIEHILRAFEAGATDYVTKPFHFDEVLARIEVHLVVGRRMRMAYAALDTAGKCFFGLNEGGELLWATPHAAQLLAHLPADIDLLAFLIPKPEPGSVLISVPLKHEILRVTFVGRDTPGEWLLSASLQPARREQVLQEKFGLSAREAEVLLWISRGKSSRDIAEILGVSPRTIDKHTEQLYNKGGFSGRAAAAAAASRVLGDDD